MAKKTQMRRRFETPLKDPGRYYRQILDHRADPDSVDEPASTELEVVETVAIQGGEKVKVRVYADQVSSYEDVLAEWEAAQSEEDES